MQTDSARVASVIAIVISALFFACAPRDVGGQNGSANVIRNVQPKLREEDPGVFLSYNKTKGPSVRVDKDKWIWLRLHNNLIWDIRVCAYDKEMIDRDVLGLHYEMRMRTSHLRSSEATTDSENKEVRAGQDPAPPRGMPTFDFCSEFILKSGKAVYFRVDRGHLVKDALLTVTFYYPWEDVYKARTGGEPMHQAYFYAPELVSEKEHTSP